MYRFRSKGAPRSGMELGPVFKEIKRLNKNPMLYGLRARAHAAQLPTSERELKKSLGLGMVGHTFNPSSQKPEAGRLVPSTHQARPVYRGSFNTPKFSQ